MSNSLHPDQARLNVGPDLSPNYLQMLSADGTTSSRQRVKGVVFGKCEVSWQNFHKRVYDAQLQGNLESDSSGCFG